jgi:branched-chain amino acid transport system substrate-binding protein
MSNSTSRRDFVARIGATAIGGAVLSSSTPVLAAPDPSKTIRVGFISPRTGPLGGFGEGDPYVLDLARKRLARGLAVGDATYPVEILDRDTQSDPARAAQLAKELIEGEGVDFVLASATPETINPVSDACEAAGVPCLGTIMPWEAWYFGRGAKPGQPSPFKWSYLFSFGVGNFLTAYVSQWHLLPTNKKVGVLYPNDADGNAVRAALIPALEKAGFSVFDPGGYEDGTSDYSSQIARYKSEKCEIFNTFPIPPDFATFWRQAAQQGYTKVVKIVQLAKTGLFPSNIEALGPLGDKLASALYWDRTFPYRSSFLGIGSEDLASGYERVSGKPAPQQLGGTVSLLDAGFQALRNSGNPKDKASLAKALAHLRTITIVGRVDFTNGPVPNVSPTNVFGSQWVKVKPGRKGIYEQVVTEHAADPTVPIGAKLLPYS